MISQDAGEILKAAIGERRPDPTLYRDAIAERHEVAAAWARLMERLPLILGPVSTLEAFPVGHDTGGPEVMRALIRSFRLTELCNLLGLPSVALPVSVENGLVTLGQSTGRLGVTRIQTRRPVDVVLGAERAHLGRSLVGGN